MERNLNSKCSKSFIGIFKFRIEMSREEIQIFYFMCFVLISSGNFHAALRDDNFHDDLGDAMTTLT